MKKQARYVWGLFSGLVLSASSGIYAATPLTFPLDVKFDTNKAEILQGKGNDKEYKNVISQLNSAPYAKVEILGYADSTGPEGLNQTLSQQRAEAVRQQFIARGVPADRIVAIGKGEEQAPHSNSTAGERSKNRRVIARIVRIEEGKTQTPGTHIN